MSLPIDAIIDGVNYRHVADTNMKVSYGEHGDEQVTLQVKDNPPRWRRNAKLRDDTFGYFWHGYVGPVEPDWNGCIDVMCRGLHHTAGDNPYYESKTFLAGTPAIEMVRNALGRCAKFGESDAGYLDDLTFQLPNDSPPFGNNGSDDVFNYIQKLTGYLATPIVWQVLQTPDQTRFFSDEPILQIKATDFAPRYRVRLTKNDKLKLTYDPDVVWNAGLVKWGNDQYQLATNYGYSNPQLPQNPAVVPSLPQVDYTVIPDIRIKRMDMSGDERSITEIQQAAGFLVNRNNVMRPISTTLTIDCNTPIESVFPAYISSNLPHHLVRNHFAIRIMNDLSAWGIYGKVNTFYITAATYDFKSEQLTLTLGDPVFDDAFRLLGSYDVNREYTSSKSGIIQLTHRDADVLVQYGMEFPGYTNVEAVNPDDATMLNNFSTGVVTGISTVDTNTRAAKFDDPNSVFQAPAGKSIDPRIIADYGVTCNFGREADSIGIKGFIQVIPCKVLEWDIAFTAPAGSDTIPSASITVQLYPTYPFTPGSPFATISISTDTDNAGVFTGTTEQHIFGLGGKIGVRVSSPNGVPGSGFQIGIKGRRLYPVLGLNE